MKGRSGKRAVNRHQTQSKASAGAQERAIERQERQRAAKEVRVEARSVTVMDDWGHKKVVGGFGDVGGQGKASSEDPEAPFRGLFAPNERMRLKERGYTEADVAKIRAIATKIVFGMVQKGECNPEDPESLKAATKIAGQTALSAYNAALDYVFK